MRLSGRGWFVFVLLLACGLGPATALAPLTAQAQDAADAAGLSGDEEARMRFELGRRYYDTGRFADAAREFVEAHRLSGRTELLYNLFLAYRDAGDDVHAVETLRAYLPTLEAGERRTQLEARLRVLEERIAARTATEGQTTGTETEATSTGSEGEGETSTAVTTTPATGSSGGGLGVVPWVVLGVGGALIVGSIITGVLALDARATLESMCGADGSCPPGFEDTQSNGQTLAIVTDVLWITGVLAAGTGAVLAILDLTSGGSGGDRASVGFGGMCTTEGWHLTANGRF